MMDKFIFTCGDVNGIGPEIELKTIEQVFHKKNEQFILICPGNVFSNLYKSLKLTFPFFKTKKLNEVTASDSNVIIYELPKVKINYGKATADSGRTSYDALQTAKELLILNNSYALVTAPLSKEALKKANVNYPGHTEMLASWFKVKDFCMMFLSNKLKCGLLTIHEPLKKVPKLITQKRLHSVITTLENSLNSDFKTKNPSLAVLGLNPHAGEEGNIGNEETDIISPAIKKMKRSSVKGPFVPDAFFGNKLYKNYDCVVGMYHDQLLIPFKLLSFERGVNYTAGLPIVRTSPDHGTAFDIAGKNIANFTSMVEAYKWAKRILRNRKYYR